MDVQTNISAEKAIHFLTKHFPVAEQGSRKPVLFHDIRVGTYLYNHEYSEDVVIAGFLHDCLEWSEVAEDVLEREFGKNVLNMVKANSKDDSIADKEDRTKDTISRCIAYGQDALIVKTADILDSFVWYTSQKNENQLEYCKRNAKWILDLKPDTFDDEIIEELRKCI